MDTEGSPAPFPGILGFSPPPQVRLVNSFAEPFNNAVATARTCYSPRVVTPADVRRDEASLAQRDEIAAGIYQAGHHTTLQHAHFQFTLENVSRHFIWSFLHSHPYYNSEQVSQRYVAVSPEKAALPPLDGRARAIYLDALAEMMRAYHRLIELLTPTVAREYGRIFPLRNTAEKPWARAVQRRAQEVARYVLPLATHAHLYHTVSGLTLHRYHRLCQGFDVPTETRQVVEGMLAAVRAVDPTFVERMEDPLPLDQTPEYGLFESFHGKETSTAAEFVREFDRDLNGRSAKLVDWKIHGEAMLAQAVRTVLGLPKTRMTDDDAIDRVMNPARNPYFGEALNLTAHAKLTRTMSHMHFTFRKKLSHTADSQDQRHRMTPGSRPILAAQFVLDRPDYVTPELLRGTPEAQDFFEATMARAWRRIGELLNLGVSTEFAHYLLPNAVSVRFEESGDLLNFHHKWTKRLCYTAQEEIWRASLDEVRQAADVAPRVLRHIAAPCALRAAAGARPFCPEGDRFCGVTVWKTPVNEYRRVL